MGALDVTARYDSAEREANDGQAAYFRSELQRRIRAIDSDAVALCAELAASVRSGQAHEANRIQRELLMAAAERREIADMLNSLSRRFPIIR